MIETSRSSLRLNVGLPGWLPIVLLCKNWRSSFEQEAKRILVNADRNLSSSDVQAVWRIFCFKITTMVICCQIIFPIVFFWSNILIFPWIIGETDESGLYRAFALTGANCAKSPAKMSVQLSTHFTYLVIDMTCHIDKIRIHSPKLSSLLCSSLHTKSHNSLALLTAGKLWNPAVKVNRQTSISLIVCLLARHLWSIAISSHHLDSLIVFGSSNICSTHINIYWATYSQKWCPTRYSNSPMAI